jgi:hypothetical protein
MNLIIALLLSVATITHAESFVSGQILVAHKPGVTEKVFHDVVSQHGGKKVNRLGQSNIHVVTLKNRGQERSVVARLSKNPNIKFAELDRVVEPTFIPTDPYYLNSWHLPNIGADFAWDISQGENIVIAILDSGVDPNHPDLSSKLVSGWNYYSNNADTSDVYGHGTKVAGAAAAITNNLVGVAGVAGQAKIMPIRVSGADGMGSWSAITSGIIHAADNGAKVANLSFLGVSSSSSVVNAAQYMKNKGGLVVVSGGNTGVLESFPVTTSMIYVSATDSNNNRTSWSSYGNYMSLAAPGASIWTTTNGGGYGAVSGTSFSSPITAGVIALMMATNPNLKNTNIEQILFSTALDLGAAGWDQYYGYGRVDANQAVKEAKSFITYQDTTPPTVNLKTPVSGQTISGLILVDVTASDNVAIERVDVKLNGSTIMSDPTSPFQFAWDTTNVPNGSAILSAVAFDTSGNTATSQVSVTISNGAVSVPRDTTAPIVQIVKPVEGNVSGKVQVMTEATDDSGSANVTQTLFIDGSQVASVRGGQLAYTWNTSPKKIVKGQHVIRVDTRDVVGNKSSQSVTVNLIK